MDVSYASAMGCSRQLPVNSQREGLLRRSPFRPTLRERLTQFLGFGSSRWRKYTRPPTSPATISSRASENAQQFASPSQVNVANTSPVSSSHIFTVLSRDAEMTRFPSCVSATALTCTWRIQKITRSSASGKGRDSASATGTR
jgi:hypothetical protein